MSNGLFGSGRGGGRGNMPFTLVAITVMILASAYGAVCAASQDADDRTDSVFSDMFEMDDAAENTRRFIEGGLGEIIRDVSTDPDLGGVDMREKAFDKRVARWFSFQFPTSESGVTVSLRHYDISLDSDIAHVDGGLSPSDYSPVYLVARGTVSVDLVSETCRSSRDLAIHSDGSCSLPLALSAGSMFECAVEGSGSLLSQMMTYQLTALAQTKILNGYGSAGAHGGASLDRVILEKEVREAYELSLRAAESLYFRSVDGGDTFHGDVDLAKEFVGKDDRIRLNLKMLYAQLIATDTTAIADRMYDYFLGNQALAVLERVDDGIRNVWDTFTTWLTSKNSFSVEPYIRELCPEEDFDMWTGKTYTVEVPVVVEGDPGSAGTETVVLEVVVEYPEVDLIGSDTVQNFKRDYRYEVFSFRDWITKLVNTSVEAYVDLAELEPIYVDLDGDGTFTEAMSEKIPECLDYGAVGFTWSTTLASTAEYISDDLHIALDWALSEDRDEIFTYERESFAADVESQIREAVSAHDWSGYDRVDLDAAVSSATEKAVDEKLSEYQEAVDDLLFTLSPCNITGAEPTLLERCISWIIKGGVHLMRSIVGVDPDVYRLCQDFTNSVESLPYCGLYGYPEQDSFGTVELSPSLEYRPDIAIGRPCSDSSVHITDGAYGGAAYMTVFPVKITDRISYVVTGNGTLTGVLGIADAKAVGTAEVDMTLRIPVVSGWRLVGVDYEASWTVLDDIKKATLSLIEPLVEPLRKAMRTVLEALDVLKDAMSEFGNRMAERSAEIYEHIHPHLEAVGKAFGGDSGAVIAGAAVTAARIVPSGQTFTLNIGNYHLKLDFDVRSLDDYRKSIVRAELFSDGRMEGGEGASVFIDIGTKGRDPYMPVVIGGFDVGYGDWDMEGVIDPQMNTGHALTVNCEHDGTSVDVVMPNLVQYREVDLSLSDVPALGTALGNIPSPIPGTKLELDAGMSVRYRASIESGVIINEFESNPSGSDSGNEWAEVLNMSGSTVDLGGWSLLEGKGKREYTFPDSMRLSPGERTIVHFEGNFLVNSGDSLTLLDEDGVPVDKTGTHRDSDNDDRTAQRGFDGSTQWGHERGTPDAANKGGLVGKNGILTKQAVDIVGSAASKALEELGNEVTTMEGVSELLRRTMLYAVDGAIDALASCLVEAKVYVKAGVTDLTSSAAADFEVYLSADEKLAGDVMRYVIGNAMSLFLDLDDPYEIDLGMKAEEGISLGVCIYGDVSPPSFLAGAGESVSLGIDLSCNGSSLAGVFGKASGDPTCRAGIVARNVPPEALPPALDADCTMQSDLWLVKVEASPVK